MKFIECNLILIYSNLQNLYFINPGQVLGQVFTRNGLKEVNYEKYKSVSFLYPIDYQQKKSYGIPLEILIIRGSLDHAQVGPLINNQGFQRYKAGTLFYDLHTICIHYSYLSLNY